MATAMFLLLFDLPFKLTESGNESWGIRSFSLSVAPAFSHDDGDEKERREQARKRAWEARKRAWQERRRAYIERRRAEIERWRAEQARKRAELERKRQQQLAEQRRRQQAERERERQRQQAERQRAERQRQEAAREQERRRTEAEARERGENEQRRHAEEAAREKERQREEALREQERKRERELADRHRREAERERQQAQNEREKEAQVQHKAGDEPSRNQMPQDHKSDVAPKESASSQGEPKDDGKEDVLDRQDDIARDASLNTSPDPGIDDVLPPATLVELFGRLTKPKEMKGRSALLPKPSKQKTPPAAKPLIPPAQIPDIANQVTKSLTKTETVTQPVPKPASSMPKTYKRVRRGGGLVVPNPIPNFDGPDLLAVGLNQRKLNHARSLGFKVRSTERFSSLDMAVTRLRPPMGLSSLQARLLLKRELRSRTTVSLNKVYHVYHAATGAIEPRGTRPSARTRPGVLSKGADHFYGASVIHWKPKLRSCAKPVRVGVIDTSIDHNHRAFRGKRLSVGNFVPEGRAASANWHGTGVLALLTGNSSSGTPGLISDSPFYVANVFYKDGNGDPRTDSISLLKALDWMDVLGVKVINMSLAGPKDKLIQRAIARMSKKGVIFVAAGGNEGPTAPPSFPAAYSQVIAVTAVNKKLRGYRYANRGKYIDLAAPGVDIWTALPGSKQGFQSGTSFAVPYVTSIVAALYRETSLKTKGGFLKRLDVRDLGPKGRDPIYGRGLVMAPTTCRSASATLARSSP